MAGQTVEPLTSVTESEIPSAPGPETTSVPRLPAHPVMVTVTKEYINGLGKQRVVFGSGEARGKVLRTGLWVVNSYRNRRSDS